MTGMILDAVLMLLLVAALGYGVRLERKLTALREGQLAFAGAVKELNTAASRAESALANLRASGQETDLLHDRIVKARALKQELESLMARAPQRPAAAAPAPIAEPVIEDERERRLATLAARLGEEARSPAVRPATAERVAPVLQAIAANQAAKQSLNRARRSLDEDLFAA